MPRIPLPQGLEGTEKLPRTNKSLKNCFWTEDNRIVSRPGIKALNTTTTLARGQFEWDDDLYQVTGTSLIKITDVSTGAFSTIGTIAGSLNVQTAIGFNTAVILDSAGNTYTLDVADTIVDISGNANFEAFQDVCHIDGRFIYIPSDGTPAKFSDVGAAGTIGASSFFDAEVLPDKNNGCFILDNTLYILGENSIELFRDVGTTPNPFQRVTGGAIQNGYIGGKLEYNNTFLFIGRETNQDRGIYAIESGRAPKISNAAIDLILTKYTIAELANATTGRLKWRGYDLATFTLRNDSFGFFRGKWFLLDTVFSGISKPWGAGFITQFNGNYYTAFEERIGVFDESNSDYGERITRMIDFVVEQPDSDYFACQEIELGISQGFNISAQVVTSISSVTDSAGVARFNSTTYAGTPLVVGLLVTISGFVANPAYNVTGAITATDGISYLEISSIAFGTNETTGIFMWNPSEAGSVAIQMSDDNVLYGPYIYRTLGKLGDYEKKLRWNEPGGLGTYEGFMGVRIYTTENVTFSSDFLRADLR